MILPLCLALWAQGIAQDTSNPQPVAPDTSLVQAAPATDTPAVPDTLFHLKTVTVRAKARNRTATVPREAWSKPAPLGTAGAVETLRELPGIGFSSDLSGQFSSCGIPVEGSLVTWEGAPLLWPWHFGGLFGALSQWATDDVRWHLVSGTPSPSQGGGWLETSGRTRQDTDQVHGGASLGTVAGEAAAWGRRGDWGWQVGARHTWLGAALDLAYDNGWSPQKMTVRFTDANAAIAWRHGPWSALVGWIGTQDTLGITLDSLDYAYSWQNLAVPLKLDWQDDAWSAGFHGSVSRYRRYDPGLESRDTLSLWRGSLQAGWKSGSLRLGAGLRADRWQAGHGLDNPSYMDTAWFGTRHLTVLSPFVNAGYRTERWNLQAWLGLSGSSREAPAPEYGFLSTLTLDHWSLEAAAEHRRLRTSVLDQGQQSVEAASPAWVLMPGAAPWTSQLHLALDRKESVPQAKLMTRTGVLAWVRTNEGLWGWSRRLPRDWNREQWLAARSDGWGLGIEAHAGLELGRLSLSGRYTWSEDVLQERATQGWTPPSRWAPWDQRHRFQTQAAWAWKGSLHPQANSFFCKSELVAKVSSGLLRSRSLAWTRSDPSMDIDTGWIVPWRAVSGSLRVPYARIDLTPLRIGREGRWAFWWTVVNLTGQDNVSGWIDEDRPGSSSPIYQIPFLPVVLGVQVEF